MPPPIHEHPAFVVRNVFEGQRESSRENPCNCIDHLRWGKRWLLGSELGELKVRWLFTLNQLE